MSLLVCLAGFLSCLAGLRLVRRYTETPSRVIQMIVACAALISWAALCVLASLNAAELILLIPVLAAMCAAVSVDLHVHRLPDLIVLPTVGYTILAGFAAVTVSATVAVAVGVFVAGCMAGAVAYLTRASDRFPLIASGCGSVTVLAGVVAVYGVWSAESWFAWPEVWWHVVVLSAQIIVPLLVFHLWRPASCGFGDVKFGVLGAAMVSYVLLLSPVPESEFGIPAWLHGFMLATSFWVIATVVALVVAFADWRRLDPDVRPSFNRFGVPFGPSLAAAAVIVAVAGEHVTL